MQIKLTTTTRGGGREKKKNIQKNLQNKSKIRIINVFLESLLSESFPALEITVHLTGAALERDGGAAAWLAGTLAAPSVQGHRLPPQQELWPYQSLFSSLL